MRKHTKLIASVAALLIAAAGVITFEACNKKNEVINSAPQMVQNKGIVYQNEVPDREAYILEFEKKLQSGAKSDEVLTAENANAFMFDLLNFDFCNINGNGPDKTYETSTYTLNVSNGTIDLDEFANLYSQISSHVYDYYHSLSFDNKNYYCIVPEIAEFDANATTTTVTVNTTLTSGQLLRDRSVDPCEYFTESSYQWDDAADTLTKYLNLFRTPCMSDETGRCYLTNFRSHTFYYDDPYFNTHPNAPKLYYCGSCTYNEATIENDTLCAYYWKYRNLACEYYYCEPCVLYYMVSAIQGNVVNGGDVIPPLHHSLYAEYATVVCTDFEPRL